MGVLYICIYGIVHTCTYTRVYTHIYGYISDGGYDDDDDYGSPSGSIP